MSGEKSNTTKNSCCDLQTVWSIAKSVTSSKESCATTTGVFENDAFFEKPSKIAEIFIYILHQHFGSTKTKLTILMSI